MKKEDDYTYVRHNFNEGKNASSLSNSAVPLNLTLTESNSIMSQAQKGDIKEKYNPNDSFSSAEHPEDRSAKDDALKSSSIRP